MDIPIYIHGNFAYPVRVNVTPEQYAYLMQYKWYKLRGNPVARGIGNLYNFIADHFHNEDLFGDDDTLLPIYRNSVVVAFSIIDKKHKHELMKHTWRLTSCGYVQQKGDKTLLHRWVLDFPPNLVVDHINWDRLDNRTENLRAVTNSENSKNAPGGWLFGKKI